MNTELIALPASKSKSKAILSYLYNCSLSSIAFLLCFLVATVITLILSFCFFNVMMFIISFLVIVILFLAVLSGSAFVIFGGLFLFYTNYLQN